MGLKSIKTPVIDTAQEQLLIRLIQQGLALCHRPYYAIAEQMGLSEDAVLNLLQGLINDGVIKRFGVIVRHRELGYRANGMVVWNIPDQQVSELGRHIGSFPCVTLSYRRPRRLPDWPYNLFSMVHGRNREQVKQHVQDIIDACGLHDIDHDILFSTHCFKQRGACYAKPSNRITIYRKQPSIKLTLLKRGPA
jgi:siroheme decarboxylase